MYAENIYDFSKKSRENIRCVRRIPHGDTELCVRNSRPVVRLRREDKKSLRAAATDSSRRPIKRVKKKKRVKGNNNNNNIMFFFPCILCVGTKAPEGRRSFRRRRRRPLIAFAAVLFHRRRSCRAAPGKHRVGRSVAEQPSAAEPNVDRDRGDDERATYTNDSIVDGVRRRRRRRRWRVPWANNNNNGNIRNTRRRASRIPPETPLPFFRLNASSSFF